MKLNIYKMREILLLSVLFGLSSAFPSPDGGALEKGAPDYAVYSEDNDARLGDFFDGDMQLDEDQMEAITKGKRNGLVNEKYRWPDNTVLYEFAPIFDQYPKNKDKILKALRMIEDVTCIKFLPRNADTTAYLYITGEDTGCHANLGFLNTKQQLNLSVRNCRGVGIAIHETLHALGFYHQHSNYNRDDYIDILTENIKPNRLGAFQLVPKNVADDYGLPYDYASIMHYGRKTFSKNGNPTIVPKAKNVTIGHHTLSEIDIKKINLMYKCPNANKH